MTQRDVEEDDPVVAAIERVLDVEREGAQQLRRAREQADRVLAEARAQADAISRRTDARISKLHGLYLQKIERDIEKLGAAVRESPAPAGVTDPAMLAAAANRVAAELTSGP